MTTDKPLTAEELEEIRAGLNNSFGPITARYGNPNRDASLWCAVTDVKRLLSEIDRLNAERESVRDAALEEAAVKAWRIIGWGKSCQHKSVPAAIRSLKSQPKENTNGKD